MPKFIVIRLLPTDIVSATSFTGYVEKLTIKAFDNSVADPAARNPIGVAATWVDQSPPDASTRIYQHYMVKVPPFPGIPTLLSAATAIIAVPTGGVEYDHPDVRLEITRDGSPIVDASVHYNVSLIDVPTPTLADLTLDMPGALEETYFDAVSIYLTLPKPPPSAVSLAGLAFLELPDDGTPPAFAPLRTAVETVLAKDPTVPPGSDLETLLASLTPAQARQVAYEIAWNRIVFPMPEPQVAPDSLNELFTDPSPDPTGDKRRTFQGQLYAYEAARDAQAERLTGYVAALADAVACERRTRTATRAALRFPVQLHAVGPTAKVREAEVALFPSSSAQDLKQIGLDFTVPAAYFYALGLDLPASVRADLRLEMAVQEDPARLVGRFATAISDAIIPTAATLGVTPDQAGRRLQALGRAKAQLPDCPVSSAPASSTLKIVNLAKAWLAFAAANIDDWWFASPPPPQPDPAAHLHLVLVALTDGYVPPAALPLWRQLLAGLHSPAGPLDDVDALKAATAKDWRDFFHDHPDWPSVELFPPFAGSGDAEARLDAVLRRVRSFFDLDAASDPIPPVTLAAPPHLDRPLFDPLQAFANAYAVHAGAAFQFGGTFNETHAAAAFSDVFPTDATARAWLEQAVRSLDELYRLTAFAATPALRFSITESLYARGFTSRIQVAALSLADLQEALIGSVAYDYATQIHAAALGAPPGSPPVPETFRPVNPDGLLTNCIPPEHLSPLGPVAYLKELLALSSLSTCQVPFPAGGTTLGALVASRRGPLGDLHATANNLDVPLPLIDFANESLEAVVTALPGAAAGAVHDTPAEAVAGHRLQPPASAPPSDLGPGYRHEPTMLLEAVPAWSSPAAPVAEPDAYDKLRSDFSSPEAPYSQPIDVSRSYLQALGVSRYATLRRFRKDITEFVLAPEAEPADFQRHLWRYPVRQEIAVEYLAITPEEHELLFEKAVAITPKPGHLLIWELYGFPAKTVDGRNWVDIVSEVPEFLKRTGLAYCEFLELQASGIVTFVRAREGRERQAEFPPCEPCCLEDLKIQFVDPADPIKALKRLAVFIRLWRKLKAVPHAAVDFARLRDIADVLELFLGDDVNPAFIRQLAALQMLRDDFHLPWSDPQTTPVAAATGAARTHLLALFEGPTSAMRAWAVSTLIYRIDQAAERAEPRLRRKPELLKLLAENLDPLSRLAGFDPDTPGDTWWARPTSALRFAEILTKIYESRFEVGELMFLFADTHLAGDDPFPQQDANEAEEDPLGLPDSDEHALWSLRRKVLDVEVDDEAASAWTWPRIEAVLRHDFGYLPKAGEPDRLTSLGEHFFPSVLERFGHVASAGRRQYRAKLAATSPLMWNSPPSSPFRHDGAASPGELWTELPILDEAVNDKLSRIRPLDAAEREAVKSLVFAPMADLAPFAFLFENFRLAAQALIAEPDEAVRWSQFQRAFARAHARMEVIARHLADHVGAATGEDGVDLDAAWLILRRLHGDENLALSSWEDDSGAAPDLTWSPQPSGGALAALLGLTGTGLLGEYTPKDGAATWRELRGPTTAFGATHNRWNSPVPSLVPAMDLTFTPPQDFAAALRNGFAIDDETGEELGGGQGFSVRWTGALLVEQAGPYEFYAGAPTDGAELPDLATAHGRAWRVILRRGQKAWTLLNRGWSGEEAPDAASRPLNLRRGAYDLEILFRQPQPQIVEPQEPCPERTGFQLKYKGPDSGEEIEAIPFERLAVPKKDGLLGAGLDPGETPLQALSLLYSPTLRDIRRTYQRAFKALLFTTRLKLSGKPPPGEGQSELGYLLDHPENFAGWTHPRAGAGFGTHRAHFDFDLLPVRDPYLPPPASQDARAEPSRPRRAALFDWWERLFDYTVARTQSRGARERPLWLLFLAAAQRQPDDPAQLLRHMGVDMDHAPLLVSYWPGYQITTPDLEDDRWAVRVWHGERWIRRLAGHFRPREISAARPFMWAAADPAQPDPTFVEDGAPTSGNRNLTRFLRDGALEADDQRRYGDVKRLNDGLRERARAALLAWTTGMDRLPLPWGGFARRTTDLAEYLLQDVSAGLCQKASRIEEAITALQLYVNRGFIGLETGFSPGVAFEELWRRRFASFRIWRACKRAEIYSENVVEWDELAAARRSEAVLFLEQELRRATLTIPVPGGLEYWPMTPLPTKQPLTVLQAREPSEIRRLEFPPEGLGLLGTPERHARPSWLSVLGGDPPSRGGDRPVDPPPDGNHPPADGPDAPHDGDGDDDDGVIHLHGGRLDGRFPFPPVLTPRDLTDARFPYWIKAAVRLGVRFLRVPAASVPPASTGFGPRHEGPDGPCCGDCCGPVPDLMDEYYFWLHDSRAYAEQAQDADIGATALVPTGAWHDAMELPGLLNWNTDGMVSLAWCRVRHGEFQPPRRSDRGLTVKAGAPAPRLELAGREQDTLRFQVVPATDIAIPKGLDKTTPPGFRYDLATDTAACLPLVAAIIDATPQPGGLSAYSYFVYHAPGAPLMPSSVFAPALLVAAQLRTHCRYLSALRWYAVYFDALARDCAWSPCLGPTAPPNGGQGGQGPDGRPAPHDGAPREPDGRIVRPAEPAPDDHARRRPGAGACCVYEDVDRATALDRAALLHILETLGDWADQLMRCGEAPEAYQQARLVLDVADRILGADPVTVLGVDDGATPMTLSVYEPWPAPLNPRLLSLYDRVDDRQALIRDCLSSRRLRNGRPPADLAYFGADPARDGWRQSAASCLEDDACCCPVSPYRFEHLVEKALAFAGETRTFSQTLQLAFEKGDGEFLAGVRVEQERQLADLAVEVRQLQWRDADWQAQALRKSKEAALARKQYFDAQLANPIIPDETAYESHTDQALGFRIAANVMEGVGQAFHLIPDLYVGFPCTQTKLPLGDKMAWSVSAAAKVPMSLAENAGSSSGLDLTHAGWRRREAEWRHQSEVLSIEIEQTERLILGAERRRDAALCDLNNQQRTAEHQAELQDYQRDKLTNHELYLFQQQELSALQARMLDLAQCVAHQAQDALQVACGHITQTFLPHGRDTLHERLMAGDDLTLAVRRMDKFFMEANRREYELTKHVSLRQHFPHAFLALKIGGVCEIEIPEWMYDLDHPGHYMRRIKSVALTIPCVAGPYVGVHARLTLLSSRTRIDPRLMDPLHRCCHDDLGADGYLERDADPRFVRRYGATEAIATSTGQNDAGLFEVSFRDERRLPFEYAGAVSRWRIELEQNQWPAETLSDMVMTLSVTAREGGTALRRAARDASRNRLPGDGWRMFDARHDLPDCNLFGRSDPQPGAGPVLDLALGRRHFPYRPGEAPIEVERLEILFQADRARPSGSQELRFRSAADRDGYPCDDVVVVCRESADLPGWYYGVLEAMLPPIEKDAPRALGQLSFPTQAEPIERLYLLCHYVEGETGRPGAHPRKLEAAIAPGITWEPWK